MEVARLQENTFFRSLPLISRRQFDLHTENKLKSNEACFCSILANDIDRIYPLSLVSSGYIWQTVKTDPGGQRQIEKEKK